MGDDRQLNNLQLKDNNGTGSSNGIDKKKMVSGNGNEEAEDTARLRLMEISRSVPPSDLGDNNVTVEASPKISSSPRSDTDDDEIRRKLMSISYSEVDQPVGKAPQPLPA